MIKIYAKNDTYSENVKREITKYLENNGYVISDTNYKIIITIGGDGTFIDAVSSEIENIDDLKFLPINTGHLGFYSENYSILENILINCESDYYDEYRLLEANDENNTYYAINEFNIATSSKTLIIDYYIDGEFLQTLRGSGLIVSTPQGSTALSKTNGGAVMYPNTNTFQVSELSSLNNNSYRTLNSSIILDSKSKFSVNIHNNEYGVLNFDSTYGKYLSKEVNFKLSDKRVKVIHKDKNTFTKRIIHGFLK